MNGQMVLLPQLLGQTLLTQVMQRNGLFLMDLLMLFGLKTWILCLMITKCYVFLTVKELNYLPHLLCSLRSMIWLLLLLLLLVVVVWFTWNQFIWDGSRLLILGQLNSKKRSSKRKIRIMSNQNKLLFLLMQLMW